MTTTRWTEYNASTKRVQKETVPSSTITAEAVSVDGFVLSQSNHAGITTTRVSCTYDHMGRRATKKVETIATDTETEESTTTTTLHQRYLYRGYLQIACCDLAATGHPCLWFITWDPSRPVATRPLAIRKDGIWYAYGWDLTKNVCEVFSHEGTISNTVTYSYTPYGAVTAEGNVQQPLQWSSEFHDEELGLVYYNYRHYNPADGRWVGRDIIFSANATNYTSSAPVSMWDILGAWTQGLYGGEGNMADRGHSDFPGHSDDMFNYNWEDEDVYTRPENPWATKNHFRSLDTAERGLLSAVKDCNKDAFQSYAHQMQDFFSHYGQGFRAYSRPSLNPLQLLNALTIIAAIILPWGHTRASVFGTPEGFSPDNAEDYEDAFEQAKARTQMWLNCWNMCCCKTSKGWKPKIGKDGNRLCHDLTQPDNPYKESAAPPKNRKEQTYGK